MNRYVIKSCILTALILSGAVRSYGQNTFPEELKKGTISEQLKYLNDHTRIYENYRAIREDMFRTISRNTLDSLANAKSRINGLVASSAALDYRIDSLKTSLENTKLELKEVTRTKESIGVLGMEVNKITYNTFMWIILAALSFLLVIGYLSFRQNRHITLRTKKDLNDLKQEFEEYQKKTRLEREKMSIDHFNEIKRLKGG